MGHLAMYVTNKPKLHLLSSLTDNLSDNLPLHSRCIERRVDLNDRYSGRNARLGDPLVAFSRVHSSNRSRSHKAPTPTSISGRRATRRGPSLRSNRSRIPNMPL